MLFKYVDLTCRNKPFNIIPFIQVYMSAEEKDDYSGDEDTDETSWASKSLDFPISDEETIRCIDELPDTFDTNFIKQSLDAFITQQGYKKMQLANTPLYLIYFIKVHIFKIPLTHNNPVVIGIISQAVMASISEINYISPDIITEKLTKLIVRLKAWKKRLSNK